MDAQTIEKIEQLAGTGTIIHQDAHQIHAIVNGEVERIEKDVNAIDHAFVTLEGFLDYLNSTRSGDKQGLIFVGQKSVVAELDYMAPIRQKVTLPLEHSEEFASLKKLFEGVNQKTLWRELLTSLDGCIDKTLFMQISNLKVRVESDSDLEISRLGIDGKRNSTVLRVTQSAGQGKGTTTTDVQQNWVWEGRIWEAFGQTFQINLTMEIDTGKGALHFIFHPQRLKAKLREASLELVNEINDHVDQSRFTVHEGMF